MPRGSVSGSEGEDDPNQNRHQISQASNQELREGNALLRQRLELLQEIVLLDDRCRILEHPEAPAGNITLQITQRHPGIMAHAKCVREIARAVASNQPSNTDADAQHRRLIHRVWGEADASIFPPPFRNMVETLQRNQHTPLPPRLLDVAFARERHGPRLFEELMARDQDFFVRHYTDLLREAGYNVNELEAGPRERAESLGRRPDANTSRQHPPPAAQDGARTQP